MTLGDSENPDGTVPATAEAAAPSLGQQFNMLTENLLRADNAADVLDLIVHAAVDVIPGADAASITLRTADGRFYTPSYTDPVALMLDQMQYETREGPCLDAADTAQPGYAFSADLVMEARWPTFGPRAAEQGIAAILASTMMADRRPPQLSGALNVLARTAHQLDEQSRDVTLLLASYASLALDGTSAVEQATLREQQLTRAIDSRDIIGQAKGILMARRGIDADAAFDLLRVTSQELNLKLVELARTLTKRHDDLHG